MSGSPFPLLRTPQTCRSPLKHAVSGSPFPLLRNPQTCRSPLSSTSSLPSQEGLLGMGINTKKVRKGKLTVIPQSEPSGHPTSS